MSYDIRKYSQNKLIEELKQYYVENKKVPIARDFKPSLGHTDHRLYNAMFGSWNNALKLAGLDINKGYHELTNEEMINLLHKYYKETGKVPTKSLFNKAKNGYPHHHAYTYRFGSWINALKISGLDADNLISKGQINKESSESHKGRLFELTVLNSFKNDGAIDCSGKDCKSPFDGVCPKGYNYDAKSSCLYTMSKYAKGWRFIFQNKNKELIHYYILGAFDENFEKLLFVWLIPNVFKEQQNLVIMYNKVSRMEKYNITDKCNFNIITKNNENNIRKENVVECVEINTNKQKILSDY